MAFELLYLQKLQLPSEDEGPCRNIAGGKLMSNTKNKVSSLSDLPYLKLYFRSALSLIHI